MNITASSKASTGDLRLEYMTSDFAASQPTSWWRGVLGVVGFEKLPMIDRHRIPVAATMTPSLSADNLCEVWRLAGSHSPLSSGESAHARVHYRHCDDLLFGSLTISEQPAGTGGEAEALLRATEIAYQEVFDVLDETEHRHLVRIWNYIPRINAAADGDERYRLFNSARQMAFRKSGRATMGTVPAASALGSPAGNPLAIYFLAARSAPRMIENPRQTSAYYYPPKFGRHSPIFSRACIWGEPGRSKLFISGTASIVGHESIHSGDVEAQTRETMVNIGALVAEANRIVAAPCYLSQGLTYKVYVRNGSDLPTVQATLAQVLGAVPAMVFLQADVCREDLLVEIEAVG
ncbi:MAG TPA: Rid family hydrolase [Steroidobacteraceae bacterium]